ncbi:hypothetical protein EDF70_103590 [Neorhizobium sp. JUb45]|nr:hypothetical protein EDF70_103590 [Neorhizobium sp. JUb45]
MVSGVGDCGFTPLCPAGHLPLKGGDRRGHDLRSIEKTAFSETLVSEDGRCVYPISPLKGEMPGRAEGGGSAPTYMAVAP